MSDRGMDSGAMAESTGILDLALLEEECISICQEMIRIPSVNHGGGVGDERAMADYVAKKLAEVGIASELIVTGENRVNVVAKIVGRDQSRPGLVLHGHLDVVPANPDDWSVDPFGGIIKDGYLWGRGAVDMKDMDAMILATVRAWKRANYQPPRNILLLFFADSVLPVDAHLMIANPDQEAHLYALAGASSVTFHLEASLQPAATASNISQAGARVGIALKPATPFHLLAPIMQYIDMVLVMSVEPGFGGQSFMSEMMPKVAEARLEIDEKYFGKIWLQVDGGITLQTIVAAKRAGADTFVAGSSVFNAPDPGEMVALLRNAASIN